MKQIFLRTWLLCGTLDALYAIIMAVIRHGSVADVWRFVASGPFGNGAMAWGSGGVIAGLFVHFTIMAAMVGTFLVAYNRAPALRSGNPWMIGTLYGLALYVVMNWIVIALRWPASFPPTDLLKVVTALFPHIAFVGIPMALMARKSAV